MANKFFTLQNQWKTLSSAIIAVISHDCYKMIAVDNEVGYNITVCESSFKTTVDQGQI